MSRTMSGRVRFSRSGSPATSFGCFRKRSPRYASSPRTSRWISTPHDPSSTTIRSRRRLSSLSRMSLNVLPLSVRPQLVGAVLSVLLLAGCGGSKHSAAAPPPVTKATATAKMRTPQVRALVRDYKTLGVDIAAMRTAAAKVHGQTLQGTPALRRTTGRFIEDLEKSHLTLKSRNRMIDHAAGAVATSCDQCFQQLEAVRPIPQIAHPH